ncbi:hypothetical protein [Anaerolentibacter hominis]|uniref:hypothetical protein n=1 Tax=Anaerolentibacter hominis TaxID=3079009 RepID=UPI0031B8A2E6
MITISGFSADTIIAILGLAATIVIAIVGGIYAIITNTKKYELTENYRKELLNWYTSVADVMIQLIHFPQDNNFSRPEFILQRKELLSSLSSLTEVGRFYFPNVIKNDNFGMYKPSAYQGYRHINLEFLLYFYQLASKEDYKKYTSLLWKLERQFTSVIFDMIEPRKRNKEYSKYLALVIPDGQSIEDYLEQNPDQINVFRK